MSEDKEETSYNTITKIKEARDNLKNAKPVKCTCTGFVLQYYGSCQCYSERPVTNARNILMKIINSL